MAEGVQGYLVVTVVEASGKSRDDTYVWDDATKEGYVKGELGESDGSTTHTGEEQQTALSLSLSGVSAWNARRTPPGGREARWPSHA